MNEGKKELLKLLYIPFFFVILYGILLLLEVVFNFPSIDELITIIENFFDLHGVIVVFISALVEGLLLVGNYFPGGIVIFLGVIAAGSDVLQAIYIVSVTSLAFFIAYFINYLLGRYGWYHLFAKLGMKGAIERAKEKVDEKGFGAIILGYWIPNLAAITATAAGILKFPMWKFLSYSVIAIIIWNTFWGTFVFVLGRNALEIATLDWKYALLIFLAWFALIIGHYYFGKWLEKRRKKKIDLILEKAQ